MDNTAGPSAIETSYAGCRFRSRLEARWAVFFDALGIKWEYEPQGFVIEVSGRGPVPYLPDFQLEGHTWVEVKGAESALDKTLLTAAANQLHGLVILGPIPAPQKTGDWGWLDLPDYSARYGFGPWGKDHRLWYLDNAQVRDKDAPWLTPVWDPYETNCARGYAAARSARFEHGQSGPYRGAR